MPKATSKTRHLENPRQGTSRAEYPVKRWCFTVNNPPADELHHVKEVITAETVTFTVVGREVGESGTPHLQGFVNLKTKRRLSTMKKWLSPRAHFEAAKGTDVQNDDYCSKEGDIYLRICEPSRERSRSDLSKAIDVAKTSSGSLRLVVEACPLTFVRYGRGLRDYINVMQFVKPYDFKMSVMVLVGDPGCGKSRYVADVCKDQCTYYKPRGPWWDGYNAHPNVVIDD